MSVVVNSPLYILEPWNVMGSVMLVIKLKGVISLGQIRGREEGGRILTPENWDTKHIPFALILTVGLLLDAAWRHQST